MWRHRRKVASERQEESPHQKLNWLVPWSWTFSLQNCEKINFYCLSHVICGILLWQPEKTNAKTSYEDPLGRFFFFLICFVDPPSVHESVDEAAARTAKATWPELLVFVPTHGVARAPALCTGQTTSEDCVPLWCHISRQWIQGNINHTHRGGNSRNHIACETVQGTKNVQNGEKEDGSR